VRQMGRRMIAAGASVRVRCAGAVCGCGVLIGKCAYMLGAMTLTTALRALRSAASWPCGTPSSSPRWLTRRAEVACCLPAPCIPRAPPRTRHHTHNHACCKRVGNGWEGLVVEAD
jgi:hypothetical protein